MIADHKIDKFLGTSGTFAGYSLTIFGVIWTYTNLAGLIFVVTGVFMAFTFDGTKIDFDSRRIKSYTSLFGLFKIGKWHSVNSFKKFSIYKSNRSYTTYSRANVPLTLKNTDIRLALLSNDGSLKIIINRYNSFEEARNEMSELIRDLKITELDEWRKA
jgi:hypothetical protein